MPDTVNQLKNPLVGKVKSVREKWTSTVLLNGHGMKPSSKHV